MVPVEKPSVNGGPRSGPPGAGACPGPRRRPATVAAAVFVVACVLVGGAVVARKVLGGVPKVVVAVAGPASIDSQPGGVGSVGTLPQNIFSVSLDAVGVNAPITVTRVFVVPGTPVRVGSPLVALSPAPFRENVEQLVLTLQQAESTLAAEESANASGHVTPGSYTNAYLATNIPELKGQVALDEQLLGIARGNSTNITSPVAGEVSSVAVVPGDNVQPGWLLLKIVNTSAVQVTANIELSDLPAVQVGDAATVSPSEVPGVTLYGKVVAIEPNATGGGLEGEVLVDVPNSRTDPVPLGTQVFVNISAPQHVPVAVPEVAVLNTQLNPIVLVVRHGRVYPVAVTVGASDSTWTAVGSGISDGTEVAVSNTQELQHGRKGPSSPGQAGLMAGSPMTGALGPATAAGVHRGRGAPAPVVARPRWELWRLVAAGAVGAGALVLPWAGLELSPGLSAWTLPLSLAWCPWSGTSPTAPRCRCCCSGRCSRPGGAAGPRTAAVRWCGLALVIAPVVFVVTTRIAGSELLFRLGQSSDEISFLARNGATISQGSPTTTFLGLGPTPPPSCCCAACASAGTYARPPGP